MLVLTSVTGAQAEMDPAHNAVVTGLCFGAVAGEIEHAEEAFLWPVLFFGF